jgi:Domain of Unknown Function with PDB structure (DUF3857)
MKLGTRVVCASAIFGCVIWAGPDAAASFKWKPITAAERGLSSGVVDKSADAEALFWEVRVTDEIVGDFPQTVLDHYIRIKIFTAHGRDVQSKIEIAHIKGIDIKDVTGRTIKPDGKIIELKKSDIFERSIVKGDDFAASATSFVLPGVEPGDMIEYQYREYRRNSLAMYLELEYQRDIPVQLVRYHVRPLDLPNVAIRIDAYNGQASFVKDNDEPGFLIASMAGIQAFREEPFMPPDHDVKPWALVYYKRRGPLPDPARFWREYASELYDDTRTLSKADGSIRAAAEKANAGRASIQEKIAALIEVCRTIRRVDLSDGGSAVDRKNRVAKNAADVLNRKEGDAADVFMLFLALAQAAGLDPRLAVMSDRTEMIRPPADATHPYFVSARAVAIRDGAQWRFVDPSNQYAGDGALRAAQEGRQALIADPKEIVTGTTAVSEPRASIRRRRVLLRLSADGSAEGEITLAYTGHAAKDQRRRDRRRSAADRESAFRKFITDRVPGAEVSDFRVERLNDDAEEYVTGAHVKAAAFWQAVGSRIFLVPAVLQQNLPARFVSTERVHPVSFAYGWTEEDRITIELPPGFQPDELPQPGIADAVSVGAYRARVDKTADGRTMTFARDLTFGSNGNLDFTNGAYLSIKAFFDRVQELDRYTVTLRKSGETR